MKNSIQELVEVSRFYGKKREFVIAGGGNTSWKDKDHLYIKASGVSLSTITENGFCILDRKKLEDITHMEFSADPVVREEQVKNALMDSRVNPESGLRPSVETSLHNLFEYSFVVHTHPTLVNALMCSRDAEMRTYELFGNKALYIPYSDPGFVLFTIIREKILEFRQKEGHDPQVVFIQNHGIFVAAGSVDEIMGIYSGIELKISSSIGAKPDISPLELSDKMTSVIPGLRMILSGDRVKVARGFNNALLKEFTSDIKNFERISRPFTPDQMVYCLSEFLYIEDTGSPESILEEAERKAAGFLERKGVSPKVIFIKGEGVVVADDSAVALDYLHDLVLDFTQISFLTDNFGGPHPMTTQQIAFIESWEVENYRKKVSLGAGSRGRVDNKVVVITGAAQGFGAGIAELMFSEGANIVVADLNEEKGNAFSAELNSQNRMNRAFFIHVNVSDAASVRSMANEAVRVFGGIDVMISNAGILRAGGLEEMTPETFDLMTRVNYNAYFLCAKYCSRVMKLQNRYRKNYFMDIIQINSKSGLKGSNKNFAYAGGKFGGIGLTQSFALELMPYQIKVNAICPGNFFDGPLWSDPENGLFVQYLRAGKIPGATTVEDVRHHYEKQVPAGRGCTAGDVVKAIYYVIDQEYETGQAVPVTGGQEMLS
jgi:NAD(P)-dependent dehydrogenase (short-subunit alcohol dehydrogenase family)/rhamnose utilization protein RhaD (predicted bifunctional aldolase and dehydrogenase)